MPPSTRRRASYAPTTEVLVVGAGFSVGAGIPLTSELEALLYGALDADRDALSALRYELHADGTAKDLVERRAGDLDVVWRCIANNAAARTWFQRAFAALDHDRRTGFSRGHDAIAELLHRRRIELVISLNWDTKLETAYYARYGQRLRGTGWSSRTARGRPRGAVGTALRESDHAERPS